MGFERVLACMRDFESASRIGIMVLEMAAVVQGYAQAFAY